MGFFRRKHDPISEKAQALNQQIQALEAEIKRLSEEAEKPQPRFRSSAIPRGYSAVPATAVKNEPPPQEHFEEINHAPLQSPQPPAIHTTQRDGPAKPRRSVSRCFPRSLGCFVRESCHDPAYEESR